MTAEKYTGNDNHGKPKSDYLSRLQTMDAAALQKECEDRIWLSAYAANNPRSDYHWQCDACYDECVRRNQPNIYKTAYESAEETI